MTDTTTAGETLTREWVEDFAERYFAAWNSLDADGLLELMTEDVVYDDSGHFGTMRGHAEVRDFVESFFRGWPDLKFEPQKPLIAVEGPKASFWWRCVATNTGPIYGLPATNKGIDAVGADLHEYRDGKIARLTVVYDMVDVLQQIGLMPEMSSASG